MHHGFHCTFFKHLHAMPSDISGIVGRLLPPVDTPLVYGIFTTESQDLTTPRLWIRSINNMAKSQELWCSFLTFCCREARYHACWEKCGSQVAVWKPYLESLYSVLCTLPFRKWVLEANLEAKISVVGKISFRWRVLTQIFTACCVRQFNLLHPEIRLFNI
jgi:hypothetical protein